MAVDWALVYCIISINLPCNASVTRYRPQAVVSTDGEIPAKSTVTSKKFHQVEETFLRIICDKRQLKLQ